MKGNRKVKMVKGVKHSLRERGVKYFGFEFDINDLGLLDKRAVQKNMNRSEFIRFMLEKNGIKDIGIDWGIGKVEKIKKNKIDCKNISTHEYRKLRNKHSVFLEMPLKIVELIDRKSEKMEVSCASIVRNILKKEM